MEYSVTAERPLSDACESADPHLPRSGSGRGATCDVVSLPTSRDVESGQLDRCLAVANGHAQNPALDVREANVFCLTAMVLRPRFPDEAVRLTQSGERYFDAHPSERLGAAVIIQKGWILDLPRWRAMLVRRLGGR